MALTSEERRQLGDLLKTAAFPSVIRDDVAVYTALGLTKRELFAAMAMQGYLGNPNVNDDIAAEFAVKRADELLTVLSEPHAQGGSQP